MTEQSRSLGVVVARLQVDDLHEGHLDIFKEVADTCTDMLVVIGLSPCKCTTNNPLDFDTRRRLLLHHFPSAKVAYVNDVYSDEDWSKNLDTIVDKYANSSYSTIMLYGSRDSFIKYYSGKYNTKELTQRVFVSGTAIRNQIALRSRNTTDFRAGAIWYALNQYPTAIPTVDVAVIDGTAHRILLGRKQGEDKFRFIGGFVQPGETYETAATRELLEETGLTVSEEQLSYVKSYVIDDWRYKNEVNKITTSLFVSVLYMGRPSPDDDIFELKWFDLDKMEAPNVMPLHRDMFLDVVELFPNPRCD